MTFIKINDHQYVELSPETKPDEPRFIHLALQTDNAEALRQYVKSKATRFRISRHRKAASGTPPPDSRIPTGTISTSPNMSPMARAWRTSVKTCPDARISRHMTHVGFYVSKPETASYYIDVLGFREFWRGSVDGKTASYSNLFVPEGIEYVEFILGPPPETLERKGTVYHIALEVPNMDAAIAKLNANPARKDYKRTLEVKVGKNHKKQMNLFDPDGNRVELMEDHTVDGLPSPMSLLPMFQ